MTNKKAHTNKENFSRYLQNKMSAKERNEFEKALQSDSFAAEALEGFETTSNIYFEKEVSEINQKISQKQKPRNMRIWAAAASILLIITAGVLLTQLSNQVKSPEVAQNKSENKTVNIPDSKNELENGKKSTHQFSELPPKTQQGVEENNYTETEIKEKTVEDNSAHEKAEVLVQDEIAAGKPAINLQAANSTELKIQETKRDAADEIQQTIRIRGVSNSNQNKTNGVVSTKSANEEINQKLIRGKVISAGDSAALPGVFIFEKGTTNGVVSDMDGNFKLPLSDTNNTVIANFVGMEQKEIRAAFDSNLVLEMNPIAEGLNEVVVVGAGRQKRHSVTMSSVQEVQFNAKAQPEIGMDAYKKYLDEKSFLPNSFTRKKASVKIGFTVRYNGSVGEFKNLNNADSLLFNKAVEIIENGPVWQPEIKNSKKVSSGQTLKITFRKK